MEEEGHLTPTKPEWKEGDLCKWRRKDEKAWKRGHVLRVLNDKGGSVQVFDKRTPHFPACVPNDPNHIKRQQP